MSLHWGHGKWVRPPAFSTAEPSKVQSLWSQLREVQGGLRAMAVPPIREHRRYRDLAVMVGQGAVVQVTGMARWMSVPIKGCWVKRENTRVLLGRQACLGHVPPVWGTPGGDTHLSSQECIVWDPAWLEKNWVLLLFWSGVMRRNSPGHF